MAKEIAPNQLRADLAHFTGTTQWFKNRMFPNFSYTDGVKYLAEKAEAYWLLDYIFSNQISPVKEQPFQVWKIAVVNNEGVIKVEDGNANVIKEFKIPFTDFPLDEYELWFVDNVLLLKSEY